MIIQNRVIYYGTHGITEHFCFLEYKLLNFKNQLWNIVTIMCKNKNIHMDMR